MTNFAALRVLTIRPLDKGTKQEAACLAQQANIVRVKVYLPFQDLVQKASSASCTQKALPHQTLTSMATMVLAQ